MRVAGVDGYRGGWVAVVVDSGDQSIATVRWNESFFDLVSENSLGFTLVDMPIGLTDGPKDRNVESVTRKFLKGKTSSVFNSPCRQAMDYSLYDAASQRNLEVLGKKLTKQTWAIVPKIREVDLAVRKIGQTRVREGHPEVSFAIINGDVAVLAKKNSLKGLFRRLDLLASVGIDLVKLSTCLPDNLPAKADDLIDAAALAWSALRASTNTHRSFPAQTEKDRFGLEMAIWA